LAEGKHTGRKADELSHDLIEGIAAGCRPFRAIQKGVLLNPIHQYEADKGEDDNYWLHEDVEAGEIEEVDEVNVINS
jgi:hypothetical protein